MSLIPGGIINIQTAHSWLFHLICGSEHSAFTAQLSSALIFRIYVHFRAPSTFGFDMRSVVFDACGSLSLFRMQTSVDKIHFCDGLLDMIEFTPPWPLDDEMSVIYIQSSQSHRGDQWRSEAEQQQMWAERCFCFSLAAASRLEAARGHSNASWQQHYDCSNTFLCIRKLSVDLLLLHSDVTNSSAKLRIKFHQKWAPRWFAVTHKTISVAGLFQWSECEGDFYNRCGLVLSQEAEGEPGTKGVKSFVFCSISVQDLRLL